jgi:hypothetical protein
MIRTQIQLTEEQMEALRRLAALKKKSMADLVRQSVELYLNRDTMAGDVLRVRRALDVVGKSHPDRGMGVLGMIVILPTHIADDCICRHIRAVRAPRSG